MKTVNKLCPSLYRALRDIIPILSDTRGFLSSIVVSSIEEWSSSVAWRLAAEETVILATVNALHEDNDDLAIFSYALRGGNLPKTSLRHHRIFIATYPLLSSALSYGNTKYTSIRFPYWMAYELNCEVPLSPYWRTATVSGKDHTTRLRIISEIRCRIVLRSTLETLSIDKLTCSKLLQLSKKNINGTCAATVVPSQLVRLITRSINCEAYFHSLLREISETQRVVLCTHRAIIASPIATLNVVQNECKLWTYSLCASIRYNCLQTFAALTTRLTRNEGKLPIAYTAIVRAIVVAKTPTVYLTTLADYLPHGAILLASDLHANISIIEILRMSLIRRGLMTQEIINELRASGYKL